MHRTSASSRTGFTLLELGAAVLIAGLLAISIVPSLSTMRDARAGAAASEITRALGYARGCALATGLPCGVRFDTETDHLHFLTVTPDGAGAMPGSLGEPEPSIDLRIDFGADLERVGVPAGSVSVSATDLATIWFDHSGVPHIRTDAGTFVADLSRVVTVRLGSGHSVLIHPHSGMVEAAP